MGDGGISTPDLFEWLHSQKDHKIQPQLPHKRHHTKITEGSCGIIKAATMEQREQVYTERDAQTHLYDNWLPPLELIKVS